MREEFQKLWLSLTTTSHSRIMRSHRDNHVRCRGKPEQCACDRAAEHHLLERIRCLIPYGGAAEDKSNGDEPMKVFITTPGGMASSHWLFCRAVPGWGIGFFESICGTWAPIFPE